MPRTLLQLHFRTILALSLSLSLLILGGCGWQLRGSVPSTGSHSPLNISELTVESDRRNNVFYRAFRNYLLAQNIQLVENTELHIILSNERLVRRPLAYSRAGVPAQYELTLSIEFSAREQGQALIQQRRLDARRNYDFDADLIIEKDQEEQELLVEMRRELSDRILTELRRAR